MKPLQCKNCKHFIRDIFYKSEGICNNDRKYTREYHVCNLLDTDEKKRDAKIKRQTQYFLLRLFIVSKSF